MGRSRGTPVIAAGGIVVRRNSKAVIAIVQRKRDKAWVLPKGKIKLNEKPMAAAKREAMEETGCAVQVHEFLGVISYFSSGGPKIVHFWRMHTTRNAARSLTDDIKAVKWLPLSRAIERLSLPHEQYFLRNVGRHVLRKSSFI
jgi:8-oxo-dGTP diphosphatase